MRIVDNLIQLRIIYLLTVPFEKTDAFKLGLIDANGNKLKNSETQDEKQATNMLFRLVWNIKKVFALVPGGKTRIGSLVAAYMLVKEQHEAKHSIEEATKHFVENFDRVWGLPFEEREIVEDAFEALLMEDAAVNASGVGAVGGSNVATDTSVKRAKIVRRFAQFEVDDSTFEKFKNGKSKYRRWSNYLNMEDASHKMIHDFAKKNPHGIIVLKDSRGTLKGIRYSRKGSGNWANLKRKPKNLSESANLILDEISVELLDL